MAYQKLITMAQVTGLRRQSVLVNTVTQSSDLTEGENGQVLSISRGVVTGVAIEKNISDFERDGITFYDPKVDQVSLTLDTVISIGLNVPNSFVTFLSDGNIELVRAAMVDSIVDAVSEKIEAKTASKIEETAALTGVDPTQADAPALTGIKEVDLSATKPEDLGKAVRGILPKFKSALNKRRQVGKAPKATDRFLVMGDNVADALVSDDFAFSVADSGSNVALTEATISDRYAGFKVVQSSLVDDDSVFAYSKSAFVLFSRTPAVSTGAKYSEVVTDGPIAYRFNTDYDFKHGRDVFSVVSYATVEAVNPQFVVGYHFTLPAGSPVAE